MSSFSSCGTTIFDCPPVPPNVPRPPRSPQMPPSQQHATLCVEAKVGRGSAGSSHVYGGLLVSKDKITIYVHIMTNFVFWLTVNALLASKSHNLVIILTCLIIMCT